MAQTEVTKLPTKIMSMEDMDKEMSLISSILERMLAIAGTASMEDKVEMAARIYGVRKKAEAIDSLVKDTINQEYGSVDAIIHGHKFDAILKQITTERMDTQRFKEERPVLYKKYCRSLTSPRIKFETR